MVEKNGQISIEWKFKNDSGFDFLRNESVCVRMEDEKERDTIFITFSKEKESVYRCYCADPRVTVVFLFLLMNLW